MTVRFLQKYRNVIIFPGLILIALFYPALISARLVPALLDYNPPSSMPPLKLSETGLYTNIGSKTRAVSDGIVAYEVNASLWNDGARTERWITLPVGTSIVPTDSDHYAFPDKTVLIKNLSLDTVIGDVKTSLLVETQFLIAIKTGTSYSYRGISYAWRRDQTDADLADPTAGKSMVFTVKANGVAVGKRWHYPSRGECVICHTNRGSLGFITQELNRPSKANASINQLQALLTAGILTSNPLATHPNSVRWAAPDDASASLEVRGRTNLAVNCSHCHGNGNQAYTGVSHNFDFLNANMAFMVDSANTFAPGPYVGKPFFDPDFPMLVYPGHPDSSYVLKRMLSRSTFEQVEPLQMPPLGTYQPDSAGLRVLADWICTMGKQSTGAGCLLPTIPELNYWAAGIRSLGKPSTPGHSFNVFLHVGILTIQGAQAHGFALPLGTTNISMTDLKGKSIPLNPIGTGLFAVPTGLHAGMYLVKGFGNTWIVTAGL